MPMINLLPWREELRQKRKKDFLLAIVGAVLMGAALTFSTKLVYQQRISYQEARNALLRTEIAVLDEQIEKIRDLEAQKNRMLERMDIIEELQLSRPEAVHLMDEAVDILPEGMYLTRLSQDGALISISGITQSSTRVSVLMRNVSDSEWLKEPSLEGLEFPSERRGEFTLFANQIRMTEDEEILR